MPTYEYRCKDCGEHLEIVQSFTDQALTECPACGGALRKVFGSIGITFKGSGFYKTDSRSGGRSGGRSDGDASPSGGSSDTSSSSGSSEASSSSGGSSEKSSGSGDSSTSATAPAKSA